MEEKNAGFSNSAIFQVLFLNLVGCKEPRIRPCGGGRFGGGPRAGVRFGPALLGRGTPPRHPETANCIFRQKIHSDYSRQLAAFIRPSPRSRVARRPSPVSRPNKQSTSQHSAPVPATTLVVAPSSSQSPATLTPVNATLITFSPFSPSSPSCVLHQLVWVFDPNSRSPTVNLPSPSPLRPSIHSSELSSPGTFKPALVLSVFEMHHLHVALPRPTPASHPRIQSSEPVSVAVQNVHSPYTNKRLQGLYTPRTDGRWKAPLSGTEPCTPTTRPASTHARAHTRAYILAIDTSHNCICRRSALNWPCDAQRFLNYVQTAFKSKTLMYRSKISAAMHASARETDITCLAKLFRLLANVRF
jgi:hypothetical protein